MVIGDASGVAFNFGGTTNDERYKDEGTRVWYEAAHLILSGKIVPPPGHQEAVKKLFAQLSQRRQKYHASGKLWMESKAEMRARGLKSPDVADALVMAFGVVIPAAKSYLPMMTPSAKRSPAVRAGIILPIRITGAHIVSIPR